MVFHNNNQNKQRSGDIILLATAGIILIFGMVFLFSASSATSFIKFNSSLYIILHQFAGVLIGSCFFYFFSKTDYHYWQKNAGLLLLVSIVLLLLVFIPGIGGNWGTARSWINVFGFSLQPSEFVKLSFLLYLAAWLENRKRKMGRIDEGSVGPLLIVFAVIAILMLLQPDLGTLSIILATSLIVYFIGGGKKTHIILIVLAGIIGLFVMVQLKPYQKDRFRCLANPEYDSQGKCYQINQALIAIGSGGLWGRGLGTSRQKYMYIPEVWGDSIFAIICEEAGFLFALLLIALYLNLFYRGYRISKNSPDEFGRIASLGIISWLTIQAFINIGGIINMIPMTGVPLPFISYGGSSIMASMAAIGVLYNISKSGKER